MKTSDGPLLHHNNEEIKYTLKKIKGFWQGGSYKPVGDGNFPLLAEQLPKRTLTHAEVDLTFIIYKHAQPVVRAWLYF